MNKKQRVIAALKRQKIDKIPWTMYKSYPPWGETELKFRNEGLSMVYQHFPICTINIVGVEVAENNKYELNGNSYRYIINRNYKTPIGEIKTTHVIPTNNSPGPGDLIQMFGSHIDQELLSWVTSFPFKDEKDYETIEYIYKNSDFMLNNDEYLKTEKLIGNEGVIFALMGKSPFQIILYELMGPERCYMEHFNNPKKFEKLYEILYKKQKERYMIASKSDALIFWGAENITSILTPPSYFEKYCVPFYNEMADILHKENKIFAVHMDGMLLPLFNLIKKTKIDVIEAFTPIPMGDTEIKKAMDAWDKVIWINFPGTLLTLADAKTIEDYTIQMIKSIAPGDKFLIGCTESYPPERWEMAFGAIGRAIEKSGNYPIKY